MSSRLGGRAGTALIFGAVAALVMFIAVIAGPGSARRGGPPLDPRSTIDSGTRAAVILLESQGRQVSIGPADDAGVHLVFEDSMTDAQRRELLASVEAGGALVIADPTSPIVERVDRSGTVSGDAACAFDGLADVSDIDVGLVSGVASGDLWSCFPVDDGWFVAAASRGDGTVVAVGSSRPFTNQNLATGHHAALLVGIVDAFSGDVRIVHAAPGSGDRTLSELIGEPVWAGLAVGLLAVVCYGLFRARRLGQPVIEADPVEIEGSELVGATARLYGAARSHRHVLDQMRHQLRDDIVSRWSLDPGVDVETIVARTPLTPTEADHLRGALDESEPADEAEFVERVDHFVHAREIVHGTARRR